MISFKRILIKNFKRYKQVEIKPSEKQGVFLFLGKNYLGKSTFLNAICWCLYGNLPFKDSIEKDANYESSLLNEDAKRENPFDEVTVELEIEDDAKEYLFVRKWRESQQSRFQVMTKRNNDWVLLTNQTVIVESLLPKNLREYFIFAGEDAESLFSPGYESKLRDGVWKVSNIEVLDRLIDHLGSVYVELQREVARKNNSDVTRDAVEKKEQCNQLCIEKNKRLKEIEHEIQELGTKKSEYLQKMKENAAFTAKINMREDLERRSDILKKQKESLEQDTNNLLTEKAAFIYLREILEEVKNQLTTDEEMGVLPPSIRADFIKQLLETKECICGKKIDSEDGSELKLKKLLNDILPADRRAPLLSDRYSIQDIMRSLPSILSSLEKLRNNRARTLNEIEQIERQLKNISEECMGSQEKEIIGLEEGLTRIENFLDGYKREQTLLSCDLNQVAEQIKLLDEQIKKEAAKNNSLKRIQLRLEILEVARDNAGFIRERITDRVRKTISLNTKRYFEELFWDHSEYQDITFTEGYKLEVIKRGFSNPSTEFSSGEKKVLGIAALRAIADLSGFSGVPIFFDAPLTKLGPEIEKNVLDMLPRLAPNKQLFIFNLDTNEMMKFAERLPKGRVFELKKDPKAQNSTIIQKINA